MSKQFLKRIIATVTVMSCLAGVAFSTSASEYANELPKYVSFSFPASGSTGYSTGKIKPGVKKIKGKITDISFIGVPTGTWVSGATVYTALFDATTLKPAWAVYTGKNQYANVTVTGSYRLGGYTSASVGASNTQYWRHQ